MKLFTVKYEHPNVRWYVGPFRIRKTRLAANNLSTKVKPNEPKRILIVKTDSLGDYVLMRNFWAEIKKSEKYRNTEITLLLSSCMKGISEYLDRTTVEDIYYLPHPWQELSLWRQYKAIKQLFVQGLKKEYDEIIFPNFNVRHYRFLNNILLAIISHHEAIGQVGDLNPYLFSHMDSLMSMTRVFVNPQGKNSFEFENNKLFFEWICEKTIPLTIPTIDIPKDNSLQPCIIIAPGAQDVSRQWHIINYAQIITKLTSNYPFQVILIGSKAENKLLLELNALCDGKCQIKAGSPFSTIIPLLRKAALFLGNDSGLFHLAVACNTPAIAISSGMSYARFMSYPPSKCYKILFNTEIKKLLDKGNTNPIYPFAGTINSVTVKQVYQAITKLLDKNSSTSH